MGKGSKAPAPPDPYKTAAAEAQFNRVDTYSPSGSGVRYGYTDPTTGQFRQGVGGEGTQSAVSTVESPWEQRIRETLQPGSIALADRMVSDNITNLPAAARVGDRGQVAQNIFDRTMSTMAPGIEKANSKLLTNLQARGLPIGGEAFNDAYGEQVQRTQDTIARLALDADSAAGSEQARQFSLDASQRQNSMAEIAAMMGGTYNPPSATPSGNAAGVNYGSLVGQQYDAQMQQHNAQQQSRAQTAGAVGSIGSAMLMKSDRRLKRDIVRIGQRGPFTLYQYRYVWDRPGTVHRGYMAQEVLRLLPRAVFRVGRWLALDYAQLPTVAP